MEDWTPESALRGSDLPDFPVSQKICLIRLCSSLGSSWGEDPPPSMPSCSRAFPIFAESCAWRVQCIHRVNMWRRQRCAASNLRCRPGAHCRAAPLRTHKRLTRLSTRQVEQPFQAAFLPCHVPPQRSTASDTSTRRAGFPLLCITAIVDHHSYTLSHLCEARGSEPPPTPC